MNTTQYRSRIPCPVCKLRWETTSGNPNLLNHIKMAARNELLARHLVGEEIKIPHADWLKSSVTITPKYIKHTTLKVGKEKFSFNLEK